MAETDDALRSPAVDPGVIARLLEHGFTVVPSFFTPDELAIVREDFERLRRDRPAKGAELSSRLQFDDREMRHLRARLSALVEAVTGRSSGPRGLLPLSIGNYISSREVAYGFHCDYGILAPSLGAFKVWIPIVKPDPAGDGMTFVRMDRFREREPDIAARIAGRGAAAIKDGTEVVIIGSSIETTRLKGPIDDICETPEVRVGDVVLFRAQDTFHRSQERSGDRDDGAERVAWAFPVRIGSEVVDRREAFRHPKKREYLGRMNLATVLACSWYHRRYRVSFDELQAFERRLRSRRPVSLALLWAAWAAAPLVWRH